MNYISKVEISTEGQKIASTQKKPREGKTWNVKTDVDGRVVLDVPHHRQKGHSTSDSQHKCADVNCPNENVFDANVE